MYLNINSYVVGPNLQLQKYDPSSGTTNLGAIYPIQLTDAQKIVLLKNLKYLGMIILLLDAILDVLI